jgi:DNA-binding transcriptional regulator YdaS (Cro superfamily)
MDIKSIIRAAGGPTKLAKALGRRHTTILGWKRVPAEHAAAVSCITSIPRHEIRPDLWEKPEPHRASSQKAA